VTSLSTLFESLIPGRLMVVALGLLPACGGGSTAVFGGGSSSGGSVPTTVSNVTVSDSKNSPAEIGFTRAGQTVDAVHIEYLPAPAGVGATTEYVPIVTLGPGDLNISSSGEANQFDWGGQPDWEAR